MPSEEPLTVLAREQLSDLRRDKPRQLGPLPLNRIEEARIHDCNCRLISKRAQKLDLVVGKGCRSGSHDPDHTKQLVVDQHRHPNQRAIAAQSLARPRILGVGQRVRNVNGFARQRHPSNQRGPVKRMRMRQLILQLRFRSSPTVDRDADQPTLSDV